MTADQVAEHLDVDTDLVSEVEIGLAFTYAIVRFAEGGMAEASIEHDTGRIFWDEAS